MGTPQLNIKDAETTAMVRELTSLTGESQTEAVRQAVKERLERHRRQDVAAAEEIYSRLAKVSRDGAANKRPARVRITAFFTTSRERRSNGRRYIGDHCHHLRRA